MPGCPDGHPGAEGSRLRRFAPRIAVTGLIAAAIAAGCAGAGSASPGATPGPSPLPAGTYSSTAFRPTLTFTLPDGWWLASDSAAYLGLHPVETDLVGIHLFRDPQPASQDPACPTTAVTGVGALSGELAAWIRGLPGLTVSPPRLVEVGGLRGVELDLAIAAGWTASCPFAEGVPTVPLIVGPNPDESFRWVVAGSERLRISILDVPGGGTVIVDIDAFEGSLMEALLERAAPIVRSFAFATG